MNNMKSISPAMPPVSWYHYSQRNSQGALLTQTDCFPDCYDDTTERFVNAYSDRIRGWDSERFKKACELVHPTGDEMAWPSGLPQLSDDKLREFAQVALDLDKIPKHVRVIYYFNESNGYDTPLIEAVVEQ